MIDTPETLLEAVRYFSDIEEDQVAGRQGHLPETASIGGYMFLSAGFRSRLWYAGPSPSETMVRVTILLPSSSNISVTVFSTQTIIRCVEV